MLSVIVLAYSLHRLPPVRHNDDACIIAAVGFTEHVAPDKGEQAARGKAEREECGHSDCLLLVINLSVNSNLQSLHTSKMRSLLSFAFGTTIVHSHNPFDDLISLPQRSHWVIFMVILPQLLLVASQATRAR